MLQKMGYQQEGGKCDAYKNVFERGSRGLFFCKLNNRFLLNCQLAFSCLGFGVDQAQRTLCLIYSEPQIMDKFGVAKKTAACDNNVNFVRL